MAAGSYDARQAAMSSAVTRPGWSAPLESRNGRRWKASTASATNPSRQARRAASNCDVRSAPAASPSFTRRASTSAWAGLTTTSQARGGRPCGSQWAAEVGQWPRNIGSIIAIVSAARGRSGWPDRA